MYTMFLLKESFTYLFLCLMSIPYTDLQNHAFNISENCRSQLNIAVRFPVKENKYQMPTLLIPHADILKAAFQA